MGKDDFSSVPNTQCSFILGNLYSGWAHKVRDSACSDSQGCFSMAEREVTVPLGLSPSHQGQSTFFSCLLTPPSRKCSDVKGPVQAKAPSKPDNASL